jgi:hypothetical protein
MNECVSLLMTQNPMFQLGCDPIVERWRTWRLTLCMCGNIHTHQHELFEICVLTLSLLLLHILKPQCTHMQRGWVGAWVSGWVWIQRDVVAHNVPTQWSNKT